MKCNDIREKMRHFVNGRENKDQSPSTGEEFWEKEKCVPSDLAPSSKIRVGLLGPHYLECRPEIRFLLSKVNKEDDG